MSNPIKDSAPLHWIRPKPVLINRTAADRSSVPPKSHRMRGPQPMQSFEDIVAGVSFDQEVVVVGHDAKSKKSEGKLLEHFFQAGFEANVVRNGVENRDLGCRAIAYMEGVSSWNLARSTWHIGLNFNLWKRMRSS